MRSQRKNQLGFTLIELMIASAVLGVVTSQIFMVLNTQKRVYVSNERVLDVQAASRTVLDLITFDTRLAGFMVPRISALSSVDGGANNADSLCISDSSYFDFPSGTDLSDGLDTQSDHFDASTASFNGNSQITVGTLDIDRDNGVNDFGAAGRGIIISDGVRSHCARITAINGNVLTFTPTAGNTNQYVGANIRAIPAVIYELQAGNTLVRNGLTLATGVEDLQVEYWVDNSPVNSVENGVIDNADEFPVDNLNNQPGGLTMDTSAIRRIRISVITVTDQIESAARRQIDSRRRPASANRVQGAPDSFRRRRFSTSVLPRNLL